MKHYFLKFSKACILVAHLAVVTNISACNLNNTHAQQLNEPAPLPQTDNPKIQVALLLDTSSSMDGLIDQAKSRLWHIVNTLTTLKYNGKEPQLEIALYEYGNDGLNVREGFIRQVTPFTSDLDLLSEKLFALRTNGGLEYCGQVIKTSTDQLLWDKNQSSMKLIYIAGNESFNQGDIKYAEAIPSAREKDIYINTIYCGDNKSGVDLEWKTGAEKGNGKYFNIDHNKTIRYVETPYDKELDVLNNKLNSTYHGFGAAGNTRKSNQLTQDDNAVVIGYSVKAERIVSKSKKNYSNSSWDVVDAYKKDSTFVSKISQNELPEELKSLSKPALEAKIKSLESERTTVQKEIDKLAKQRAVYIEQQNKNSKAVDDLGQVITSSILELAKKYKYTVVE